MHDEELSIARSNLAPRISIPLERVLTNNQSTITPNRILDSPFTSVGGRGAGMKYYRWIINSPKTLGFLLFKEMKGNWFYDSRSEEKKWLEIQRIWLAFKIQAQTISLATLTP
jgi:uncharacterized protein YfiM (DUF2279 family)